MPYGCRETRGRDLSHQKCLWVVTFLSEWTNARNCYCRPKADRGNTGQKAGRGILPFHDSTVRRQSLENYRALQLTGKERSICCWPHLKYERRGKLTEGNDINFAWKRQTLNFELQFFRHASFRPVHRSHDSFIPPSVNGFLQELKQPKVIIWFHY